MEKPKKSWLAVTVVVTSFVMVPRQGVAGDLRLTLVVYDHAHLGEEKVAEVESITSEIFRRTGAQLVWIEGFAYAAKRRDVLTPPPKILPLWWSSFSQSPRQPVMAFGPCAVALVSPQA